ncbi:uncharacterized protein E0L32_001302 [Thyridium curvatum]|uniref:Beta-lactamase-related domain-containing protein n=1 Tax=Thyridium curvatum TaxID=1093900 RepID=A0A507AIR9_9PEZI|nr:uncharacterized protein E0L32_001302 [Thyridium curvatum]TPX10105.1 hypothetical protein E0L32_001302 [Thyridium curvatum]
MAESNIDTAFQAALDAGKIKGAVICATDREGRFVYNKVMGERTLLSGEKRPQQLDDVLFLASATKLMTAVAAMACVDDGLLSLTGDLSSVVPELAEKQVLTGFSEDGETPILEPQERPVTLEMLLTHSAGTTYHFLDPKIARFRDKFCPPRGPDARMPVEQLFDYPLAYQPGSAWMYGQGCDWAGRAVERATGKTLGGFLRSRVFSRLGVADAAFYPVAREDLRARMVDLNPEDPEAVGRAVLAGMGDTNACTRGDFGGHGLFMTAPDYVTVLRSLLANDGKVLRPETVDAMFEDHLSPSASESFRAVLKGPGGDFICVGTSPDNKAGHGLSGLLTLEDVEGWYGTHTLSWGGGLTFAWFVDRTNNLCGVGAVMASIPVDGELPAELKQVFRRDIYRKRAAWEKDQAA